MIADKHGIDIAELDATELKASAEVKHRSFGEWAYVPPEVVYSSLICNRFFEVSSFEQREWQASRMIFVGLDHHLTISSYVFDFLCGEFRRCWNRRTNKRLKNRKQFIFGAYVALREKMVERFEEPKPAQLTLALEVNLKAKRKKYIEDNFGEMQSSPASPKKTRSKATSAGYYVGSEIEIRPAINGHSRTREQLAPPPKLLGA